MSDALLGVLIGVSSASPAHVVAWVTNRGESERLTRQLKHKRALREREELRNVIDDAIRTVHEGIYAAVAIQRAVDTAPDEAALWEAQTPVAADLRQAHRALNGYESRLAIRLGVGGELAEALKQCRVQLGVFQMISLPIPGSMPDDENRKELNAQIDRVADRVRQFETKAVAYAGSELGTEEEPAPPRDREGEQEPPISYLKRLLSPTRE